MGRRLEDRIRELAEPLADELGIYLYDLQLGGGKRLVIRLRVERKSKQGSTDGVTIDECAVLSRRLEQLLDLEDTVPEEYALEVSSPGLERELKQPRHFEGALGEHVRVQVVTAAGTATVEGALVEATGEHIVLEGESAERTTYPLAALRRAQTIYRG
jgi:ribosome maturation factor RimP